MKLKKILSSALIIVMLFMSLVAVLPVNAFAAEEPGSTVTVDTTNVPKTQPTAEKVKNIVDEYLNYNYASAEDMLQYEIGRGYLASAESPESIVYVNVYTGLVYYKNKITGQILTSNPIDPGYQVTSDSTKLGLMSQIELTVSEKSNSSSEVSYNSLQWIREGAVLEVTGIEGKGLNVKYTLGDISEFFISPGVLLSDTFKTQICQPIFDNLEALLVEYCGEFEPQVAKKASSKVDLVSFKVTDHNDIEYKYSENEYSMSGIKKVIDALSDYAKTKLGRNDANYKIIKEYCSAVTPIFTDSGYGLIDSSNIDGVGENIKNEVAAIREGKPVYKIHHPENVDNLRAIDKALRTACPEYTMKTAEAHEQECGYDPPEVNTPFITCCIRYLLDADGILTIDIPTDPSNLVFALDDYSITSITPLKYFGAGDMDKDGYIFYPDGSGTIIEFSDFYYGSDSDKTNTSIYVDSPVFGNDYVYSTITGQHREQITMPVFGMVNEVNVGTAAGGYKEVTGGFFTIIESGASTATLCFESGGGINKYAATYSVIRPYPSDKYDLSKSLSVSGLGFYYVVAEKGFEGSYKYRVNMLTDEEQAVSTDYVLNKNYYPSDYAGMAACYRNYLVANGTLTPLAEFSKDLPLYIEALGSMDIIKRILTFPVTVSTSLTTFDDIETIYDELSNVNDAVASFRAKAADYRAKAAEVAANNSTLDNDDEYIIEIYQQKAAHYEELADKVYNICNINFRLTGFANGGMYFTYPAKVKWERSVGGKRGFKDLLENAGDISDKAGYNFGIFPDFDFLFINNTALFDGINANGSAARMVDNRYASKQSYDSIQQKYESLFALVLSTDSLDDLYTKFEKKYSKYDIDALSVSTLGSTLNSNFDEDNLINREAALGHVTGLLDRMANGDGYSLMTDVGNIYSVKYVDHILNATIDSSHFRYSSFTVPFYGMVLHGYVNYAGSPLNYSGSPDYDILRSIENGASLYYILCYENTNHLKEDELLSQYYGIDYANWHENILENYVTINEAIGDLQKHNIVDHDILIAERIIDSDEMKANYERLVNEFLAELSPSIENRIDEAAAANPDNHFGYQLVIDKDYVKSCVDDILSSYTDATEKAAIKVAAYNKIDVIIERLEERFPAKAGAVVVDISDDDDIDYDSQYSYVTKSVATDKDGYVRTDFTCDNGSVVMVVYRNPDNGDEVVFILNYNTFSVDVRIDNTIDKTLGADETDVLTLGAYGCYKITSTGSVKIK